MSHAMKISKPARLIILTATLFLAIGWQSRTISRLAKENVELSGARQESERLRGELEETTKRARQYEVDAYSLRIKLDDSKQSREALREKFLNIQERAGELRARLDAAGLGKRESEPTAVSPRDEELRAKLKPFPSGSDWVYKSGGRVGGVTLWSAITQKAVLAGESWSPGRPLPISFEEAERVARRELQEMVRDERPWEVAEIRLHRLNSNTNKWHYGIQLRSRDRLVRDYLTIYVSMTGSAGITGLAARGD